jgi:amino acid transporter
MAQTRKRRRRKHRGTQGGRIDTKRRGRPRTRAEAQQRARSKKRPQRRGDQPPSWRSAIIRGFVISALLIVTLLVFRKPIPASIAFGVIMLAIYIPMGYQIDRFMWRRRQLARMKDD